MIHAILRLSNPTTQQAIQHTIPRTNLAPLPCIVSRLRITSRAGLRLRKCAQQASLHFTSTAINQQALLLGAYQTVYDLSHASYFSHNFTRPTQFLRDSQQRI